MEMTLNLHVNIPADASPELINKIFAGITAFSAPLASAPPKPTKPKGPPAGSLLASPTQVTVLKLLAEDTQSIAQLVDTQGFGLTNDSVRKALNRLIERKLVERILLEPGKRLFGLTDEGRKAELKLPKLDG